MLCKIGVHCTRTRSPRKCAAQCAYCAAGVCSGDTVDLALVGAALARAQWPMPIAPRCSNPIVAIAPRYSMAGGRGVDELVGVGGSAPPPAGDSAPAAADMLRKMASAAPAEGKKRKGG